MMLLRWQRNIGDNLGCVGNATYGTRGLAFNLDGDAFVDDGLEEGAHLVGGDFAEVVGGGGAVDGVGHDLAGA